MTEAAAVTKASAATAAVMPFALALSIVGPLSIDAFLPSVQAIEAEFAIPPANSTSLLSYYLAAYALMTLWHGALTDAFGRRTAALSTLTLYTLTSVFCAFAMSFSQLQFGRVAQGFVSGAGLVVARAMLRDTFVGPQLQRRFSILVACLAVPPVLGPLLGGMLVHQGSWRWTFYGLSALALALLIAATVGMPETLAPDRRTTFRVAPLLRSYGCVLSRAAFLLPIGATALLFAGQFVYIGGSPAIIVRHYGMNETDFVLLFIPITIGVVLGGLVGARAARSVAPGIQATIGLALAAAASALDVVIAATHWSFPPLTFTPSMLYAFGLVLVTPVATTQTLARATQNAGIVSSCQVFLQMLGMLLAAWIVVPLLQHSLLALACAKAALLAGACLLWFASSTLQPMRSATT